ncbi:outer membrane protein assembly factor BamA [Parvibaculum sp.]|uniref:outer membrane protein assembly factor BamA n=1 Tax=Parvibaculum sp. TaxID=2024848 RepID=UPI0025D29686|nr:outer membrane protein assembly factor BamA [Parvibaculum sp.]
MNNEVAVGRASLEDGVGMGRLAGYLTRFAGLCGLAALLLSASTMTAQLAGENAMFGTAAMAADAPTAKAALGPVIRHIEVEGNQRIERETVLSYMVFHEGSPYNPSEIDSSLKTLFATGLFADIGIRRDGDRLIVSVVENPIINRVAYEGNHAIKEEDLNNEVQLKPRTIYTRAKVQADVTRIIELYRRGGRFAATVEPKVIRLPQNRVDLVFEINEGPKTKIAAIDFLGNKEFSDGDLREIISTSESAWWKFLSSSDNYDPDRLTYDRELLRRFYLSKGYADFRVISAVADLSRDDSSFHITFTVEEGEVYSFGKVTLKTNLEKLNKTDLEELIKTKSGETYNATLIDKSTDALTFAAGAQGYAFAQVRPRVQRNRDKRTIDMTYTVSEGPRVYVERINISGNVRTLDRVIRRQMKLVEGDAFNKVLLDKSEKNIRGLQYFSKVDVSQQPGSAPDKTIVNVAVQEQSTGSLSLSFGFSSVDSAIIGVSLNERNFLGRGLQIGTSVSLSRRQQLVQVHYTDPYFLDRDLVGGVDLFGSETNYQDEASFDSRTKGFGLRFGFPLSDNSRFLTRYQLRLEEIFNVDLSDPNVSEVIKDAVGKETRSVVGYDYYLDNRDDPVTPTAGWDLLFSQDFAGLGGSVRYISSQFLVHAYHQVAEGFVGTQRFDLGYIKGIGEEVRLNDRFFKGGADFRGFKSGGIGPRDLLSDDAVGAEAYAFGTTELSFPNGLPQALGITTSLFMDYGFIGKAYTNPNLVTDVQDKMAPRVSTGISLNWKSPFGPVRLDFAQVLVDEDYDQREAFRFSAGTSF